MSYEGVTEYIDADGFYGQVDCREEPPVNAKWTHEIDYTNGLEEDNPCTYAAEKEEIGFVDVWREDHYGNRYAIKRVKWQPIGSEWREYKGSAWDWD